MRTLTDLMSLRGRVALVTGGAGQLGTMVCATLAEMGAAVVVLDVRQEACEDAARKVAAQYAVETLPLAVDLEDSEQVASVSTQIEQRFGRLDVLIHCAAMAGTAGVEWAGEFTQQSREVFQHACAINMGAPFLLTQKCVDLLRKSGHGSVINFLSIYGISGPDLRIYEGMEMGNSAAYAATKGGLLQLTRWMATVLAPQVRVNAIAPGGIRADQAERFVRNYSARTPLGRMGVEEDLKGAIAYLASDLSQYVTGHNLVIDGGWTAW